MLPAGHVLEGRYRIESVLGRGSMGVVYLAQERPGDRRVAIKELALANPKTSLREAFEEQFKREAGILQQLKHVGLPALHEFFVADGQHYLVMDYIDGQTLEAVRAAGPVEEAQVLRWAVEICEVLRYLHAHQPPIIFRDLKPSNVMLGRDGRLRLLDFGIAKLFDPAAGLATPAIVRGSYTPGFAAPEQYRGMTTDARTDIYALGATLYYLLHGQPPPQAMHLQMGARQLAPLQASAPTVALVEQMLQPEQSGRPQSVSEVRDRLQPESGPRRSDPPWRAWVAWAIGVLVLLAALYRLAHAEAPARTLIVDASPSPCGVYATGPPERYLGLSGQPLALQPTDFQKDRSLRLRLHQDGYVDAHVRINSYQMTQPELRIGPYALTSSNPLISLANFTRTHVGPLLLAGCGLILGLGLLVARLRRPYRQYRETVQAAAAAPPATGAPEQPSLVGRSFGGYVLTERLGTGGTSTVYRGQAENADVAVKVIDTRGEPPESPFLRRIRREIRIMAALEHPNIMRLLQWGEEDNLLYIVMPRLEGTSLRAVIPPEGLPLDRFRAIFQAVLDAVIDAHEHGITHRDLKPDNILISGDEVRVIDFGLSRSDMMSVVTLDSAVMGTPPYMAPEQFDGNVCNPLADQYSMGIVAYEMLAGHPPFQADDVLRLAYLHCYEPCPPLRSHRPDVPPGLEQMVLRMLGKSPADRFPSLRDVQAAFTSG